MLELSDIDAFHQMAMPTWVSFTSVLLFSYVDLPC